MVALRVITYIAAGLSAFFLFMGMRYANGAPQQASIAAVCAVLVIIPYAVTSTAQRGRMVRLLEELKAARLGSDAD